MFNIKAPINYKKRRLKRDVSVVIHDYGVAYRLKDEF